MTLTPSPTGYPIKLVRDRTPDVINASGDPGDLFYGPLPNPADHGLWLRRKLGEEVTEYLLEPGVNELADVLAVVHALASIHGLSVSRLVTLAQCDKRGGFQHGTMMYGRHPEFDKKTDEKV